MGGRWGAGVFQLPETLLSGEIGDKCSCELCVVTAQGARVMSLTDGTSKMSKSDPNDSRQVAICESPNGQLCECGTAVGSI